MLSRVITSCGGTSNATTRSETVWILVSSGGRNLSPGPFAPHDRPRTNSTPRSYSLKTRSPERTYKKTIARAAVRTTSMYLPLTREGFHDHRRALAAADAGGAKPEPLLGATQRVKQVDRDACARGGEGMPDGDRAAVHVGLVAVQSELLLYGEILRRERFVHLDEIHLLEFHPGLLERLARRRRGSDAHVARLDAGHRPRHQPAKGLQAVRLGVVGARDHGGGRSVHDA